MRQIQISNYVLNEDVMTILTDLRMCLRNGKLKDITQKGSDNITVTCPTHSDGHESKPAASIYIGENEKIPFGYFRCFVCEDRGPFEYFIAKCFDSSVEYAKSWLISKYGVKAYEADIQLETIRDEPTSDKRTKLDPSILNEYQPWCPYLAKRGLSRETCERFNVKYDAYHRQVVFPCYDRYGNLIMMPRRSIDTKIFYLDKDVEKPVYNLDMILRGDIHEAIVTEGPFDCLTANQYGFPAIATLGNPSDEQIDQISRSCITTLYLMFDNDDAGRRFADKVKKKLDSSILTVLVKIPDPYKDINELPYDVFKKAVEDAKKSDLIIV